MSDGPNFDEIVGAEATATERERLRRVHDLLVEAGPPPELTPGLAAGPGLREVRARRLRHMKRRSMVLLAAAIAAGGLFGIGYGIGTSTGGPSIALVLPLKGTHEVPNATATLQIHGEVAGNWPMSLTVKGLPTLPAHALYEVYLVRDGKPWASCGTFVVADPSTPLTVPLNAPYKLEHGDTWVVTRQLPGNPAVGPIVLKPGSASV